MDQPAKDVNLKPVIYQPVECPYCGSRSNKTYGSHKLTKALEELLEEYKKTIGNDNQRLEVYLSFKEVLEEQIKNFEDFGRIVSEMETVEKKKN